MKAVLCKEYGPPDGLVLGEVQTDSPGKGQVLVSVKACGINFPDVLIIEDKYQFKPELPFSPGGEVSGVISSVGEGVEGWSVGEEVIAFVLWGGLAEFVVVDVERLVRKPQSLTFTEAAAFLLTYGTVLHAFKDRAKLRSGESVLVLGASGGVGTAAIQLAKEFGATVIAATSSSEKAEYCKSIGADFSINYIDPGFSAELKKLTDGRGVDVVFDPVGGSITETAIRSCAWEGRYLVVGFASGDIPKVPLNLLLLKGISMVGVFWGEFFGRDAKKRQQHALDLISLSESESVKPQISKIFPLSGAAQAINHLRDRQAKGKVVVEI